MFNAVDVHESGECAHIDCGTRRMPDRWYSLHSPHRLMYHCRTCLNAIIPMSGDAANVVRIGWRDDRK